LETVESRQDYMQRLRRVYDMLKAKWFSEHFVWTQDLVHLRECIRRDAIRTDPTETFLTGYTTGPGPETDDNLQVPIPPDPFSLFPDSFPFHQSYSHSTRNSLKLLCCTLWNTKTSNIHKV
jgi:hypothetical protein